MSGICPANAEGDGQCRNETSGPSCAQSLEFGKTTEAVASVGNQNTRRRTCETTRGAVTVFFGSVAVSSDPGDVRSCIRQKRPRRKTTARGGGTTGRLCRPPRLAGWAHGTGHGVPSRNVLCTLWNGLYRANDPDDDTPHAIPCFHAKLPLPLCSATHAHANDAHGLPP